MDQRNATVVDVAKAAGVGVGTVSRVINNSAAVSPATAKMVRQAIARLGYRAVPPSKRRGPTLGKPRSSRTVRNVVLLILGDGGLRWIVGNAPVYATVLHGIELAAHDQGANLLIQQATPERSISGILRDTEADGVIVFGEETSAQQVAAINRRPTVWVMGSPQHYQGDLVQPDHTRMGVVAAEYALEKKHRHGAYLGRSLGSPGWLIGHRGSGFQWAMHQGGGDVELLLHEQLVIATHEHNDANLPVLSGLIEQFANLDPRPTVLMLQSDLLLPAAYRELEKRGIRPQRDVMIISCNNERPYLSTVDPQPVIVDLQAETIGRHALERLVWRVKNPNEPTCRIVVSPLLIQPDGQ